MRIILLFSLFSFLISPLSFAAKSVCTVKNIQTNQLYQSVKGRRSYSVAKNESAKEAFMLCAHMSNNASLCKLTHCYKR